MPIQPIGKLEYSIIADEEDVSSVDNRLSIKYRRSNKLHWVIGCAVIIVCIFMVFCYEKYYVSSSFAPIFVETTKDGKMMEMSFGNNFGNTRCNPFSESTIKGCAVVFFGGRIKINSDVQYQEIIGFGGAFTEASAINFARLPKNIQYDIIAKYFGEDGIGFTLGRLPINSCDFSPSSYSFDDVAGDYELEFFDKEVTHDTVAIIPFIQQAMEASNYKLRILATSWSPPAWMKVAVRGVQSMNSSAQPNGLINDPKVKTAWSNYLSKFIDAYKHKGIPIWALTPQNEPEFAAPWEACAYNASYMLHFIENYLGPVMRFRHPEVKIFGFDHNKDHLENWTRTLLADPHNPFIDGMAFHWYGGDDRIFDGTYGYDAVNFSHHHAPHKMLLSTEGCSCPGVALHDWLRAERLAHDVIYDLRSYAQGWIDWNLIVDAEGGPNHLHNYCDACFVANENFSNVAVQPKFHYFGHISKFMTPGSVRVHSEIIGNYGFAAFDPNIQPGIELGVHACEHSPRQFWVVEDRKLKLKITTRYNNRDVDLCAGYGDINRIYLKLWDCSADTSNLVQVEEIVVPGANSLFQRQFRDQQTNKCITVANRVTEPGGLLSLTECTALQNPSTDQLFLNIIEANEVKFANELCLTAGWPFLYGVAVKTGDKDPRTVLVVVNEADLSTSMTLVDESSSKNRLMAFSMSPRSIQTIIF